MAALDAVRATVTVHLRASEAFEVFTNEIETWYRRRPTSSESMPSERGVSLRIECGPNGRVLRIDPAGDATPIAAITAWEPGRRLQFVDHHETEVEVTFEETAEGTRVVLEHRGLSRLPAEVAATLAQYAWRRLPLSFALHIRQ
jgi:hypothetical protein